ncbi:methyltransferase domain-containing protein [Thalassotalea ganghwensis]
MSEQAVKAHYRHGDLLSSILNDLASIGKTQDDITYEELGFLDEFHLGGPQASERLLLNSNLAKDGFILDVGCGLAGTCRRLALANHQAVIGLDLSLEYCQVGSHINGWFNLDKVVSVINGSATQIPVQNHSISGAIMLHVGMNIEDKNALFKELKRALKPSSKLAIYDLVTGKDTLPTLPLPFASTAQECHLATIEHYIAVLESAGFNNIKAINRKPEVIEYLASLKRIQTSILSVKSLLKKDSSIKMKNLLESINENTILPYEIYATS